MNDKNITGKVVLITGGTRGIGRRVCSHLARKGFQVLFTYKKNKNLAKEVVDEVVSDGLILPKAYQCDMTQPEEVKSLIKELKSEFREIDVLINNAGILGDSRPFLMTKDDDWWNILNVNVSCVINICRAVLPIMISGNKGIIINVTSLSGQKGNQGQSAYAASKAAIVAFSKSLVKEVGNLGININCISPGLIDTDMTKDINPKYYEKRLANSPLKRMGQASEVANLISYIADEAPPYLVGQEITIDGGISV